MISSVKDYQFNSDTPAESLMRSSDQEKLRRNYNNEYEASNQKSSMYRSNEVIKPILNKKRSQYEDLLEVQKTSDKKSNTLKTEQEFLKVAEVHAGKIFGELALLKKSCKRAATIIAAQDCHLATLDAISFQLIKKKQEDVIGVKIKHLQQIPFLSRMSNVKIQTYQANFKEHTFTRG